MTSILSHGTSAEAPPPYVVAHSQKRRKLFAALSWPAMALILLSILAVPYLLLIFVARSADVPKNLVDQLAQLTIAYVGAVLLGAAIGWRNERKRRVEQETVAASELRDIAAEQQRKQNQGEESEALVANTLLYYAREIDADAWVGCGMVLRYPEVRAAQMSRFEVDNLLITRFGIFLVEVKNWKHRVSISPDGWQVHKPEGMEKISSPLAQSTPKQRVLRTLCDQASLGHAMTVDSIVVMSHPNAQFPMQAPRQVLYLSDVRYYLRLAYLRAEKAGLYSIQQVQNVRTAIAALHDAGPQAKHHFLLELAEKNHAALDYLALENRRQALLARPPVRQRPFWRNGSAYLPLVFALTVEAVYLGYVAKQPMAAPLATPVAMPAPQTNLKAAKATHRITRSSAAAK